MKKNHVANFVGQAAASARQAIEQANARARYQTAMQAVARYHAMYTDAFADMLAQAIRNTAAVTGLVVPDAPHRLLPTTFPVHRLRDGRYVVEFVGWRHLDCRLSAPQVQSILTREIRRLCAWGEFPWLCVWVQFDADFGVRFRVGAER